MPTIANLRQRHPTYNGAQQDRLAALYEGGARFEGQLTSFLPQRQQEPGQRYALRKQEAVYRNYIGPIIDYFTALLFSSSPRAVAHNAAGDAIETLPDFYSEFRNDCDRQGTDLDDKMKMSLTGAMVAGKSWIWLQHSGEDVPENLAKFEASKVADTWATCLDSDDVLDWDTDEAGNLAWAIVHEKSAKRTALSGGRSTIVETWHHIQVDRVDTYRIEYEDGKKPNEDRTEVPLVSSVAHRYGTVPLICVELPVGLWVANRLETPQLAHFRLSNAQTWSMSATCYAMPVFKVKSPEAFQKMVMGAGYGFFIHPEESVEWTAPAAAPFAALSNEIQSHKDEIYRIAHTMALGVENNAAAVGRSGDSKAMDARATSVVLLAYARLIKEKIELVYDLVSRARGDKFVWSVDGLDDFAGNDLLAMVDVLDKVESAGGIPSKTFNVELKSSLAESLLPELSLKLKNQIKKEIEQGVPDQTVAAKEKAEAKQLKAIGGGLRQVGPNQGPK